MSSINNKKNNQITVIREQKESNSVTFKIPDYLKISIEYSSVISIDSKDYLSLRCSLNKENLSQINDLTVNNTIFWIDSLRKIVEYYELWWDEPLVNINPEDEIVFEWWHNGRKITVYISDKGIEYLKVFGKDIDNEMQEGLLNSFEDIKSLWKWISEDGYHEKIM